MAVTHTLNAEKREDTGKGVARKLRQAGRVPAVVYGRDMESVHLAVDAKEAERLFHTVSVENTIIDLAVEGEKDAFRTLVREIQTHPHKAHLLHIDFLRIQEGVAVDVEIPVHLNGVPVGVKMHGGVLEQIIHELPVRCIPAAIPESVEVDVTALDINDSLHVYDLDLGEEIEIQVAQERTICLVAMPKVLEEPEPEEEELPEGELPEGEVPEGEEGAEGDEEGGDEESEGDED